MHRTPSPKTSSSTSTSMWCVTARRQLPTMWTAPIRMRCPSARASSRSSSPVSVHSLFFPVVDYLLNSNSHRQRHDHRENRRAHHPASTRVPAAQQCQAEEGAGCVRGLPEVERRGESGLIYFY